MHWVAIASGAALGVLGAIIWHMLSKRIQTRALFDAMGRAVRAMLATDGGFFQAYGALLVCVGSFALWNLLALAGALLPLAAVWPIFAQHVWLAVTYSLTMMVLAIYLQHANRKIASDDLSGLTVNDSQFFLLQVVESAPWLVQKFAALETRWLRKKLTSISIDRPVFITGLARSGTTMLLELLSQVDTVGTHRYRDFPFLQTPYFWSHFVNLFGVRDTSVPRAHQDGIQITAESPEAFEEPLWRAFLERSRSAASSDVLRRSDRDERFDALFVSHIKKILLIRKAERYVSKGNYNVTRLDYLNAMFPDAMFVVPIRHPATHVKSLVRQHELFTKYVAHDNRVAKYLISAGHFEFGPQRQPISIDDSAERTLEAWDEHNEPKGYAIQWAAVYGHLLQLMAESPTLASRILVVRYEDFCERPEIEWATILEHAELTEQGRMLLENLQHIKTRPHEDMPEDIMEDVWRETQDVAAKFGYQR